MSKNPTIRKFVWGVSFLVALFVNFPIIIINLPFLKQSYTTVLDIGFQIVTCFIYSIFAIHFTYKNIQNKVSKTKQIAFGFMLFVAFVTVLSLINIFVVRLPPKMIPTIMMRGFLIAIIAYFFSRFLIETDKKNEALLENEQLKHENLLNQLNSLKNQLNPHFLFNSLNTLSWLINEDKERSQLYLQKLSQVLRYSLSMQEQPLVFLKEELTLMDNYIFLLQMRFGENLKIVKHIEGSDKFKIPPHSLQLLIENAIKHNIVSSLKPLTIKIEVEPEEKIIKISNSINLKLNSSGTGIGLANLSERFKILVGEEIDISQNEEFTVILPLIS
ncbi:histidine kinase [Arcicella sp. LKC2W]|uniref:sensor histidine kinase n=1 Tax=Arcicella sp. LKC2W TaxID=2984198 RepID=UPI002B1F42C8|nr:histidine kinase [Arcicella sp. LKC2W]MEA5460378.1 histidine kinase [Arcicella sp. LKC2W]